MAKFNVVHSEDAATIIIKGNPTRPEPSTAIIKFPGGHVEVCRTSDGSYWAHISVKDDGESKGGNIKESRIDYNYDGWEKNGIIDVPDSEKIEHIAIRVYK